MALSADGERQGTNPWRFASYEDLVAAFLLRDKVFASKHAPLLAKSEGKFFGNFLLDDLITAAMTHFKDCGELLPPPALVAQVMAQSDGGASEQTLRATADRVFELPLEGAHHVSNTLVASIQDRMLADLETQRPEMFRQGDSRGFFSKLRDIERLGFDEGTGMVHITNNMDTLLLEDSMGVTTGFPSLNEALAAGGLTGGELLLVIGDPCTGKTQVLHHVARAVLEANLRVAVLTLETSHKNTRLRILRGMTGWSAERMRLDPRGFREAVEALGPLKLHVKYEPSGSGYTVGALEADIDRVQQETGEKVDFVVRDYGELMATEIGSWQEVRRSYLSFKAMLGRLGIPGADACQRNKDQKISFYDLMKDADVGMTITETEPGGSRLIMDVVRVREGARTAFNVHVDRSTGIMDEMQFNVEDLELQHGESKDGGEESADPGPRSD